MDKANMADRQPSNQASHACRMRPDFVIIGSSTVRPLVQVREWSQGLPMDEGRCEALRARHLNIVNESLDRYGRIVDEAIGK